MSNQEIPSGVLFADVCDSTGLYKKYSTEEARALILETLHLCSQVVIQHQGEVLDRIGDEIMCRFPDAEDMVKAAVAIQEGIDMAVRYETLPCRIRMRVGCHYGLLIYENDSVFGDTVHTARRLASAAKADQILTSREVISEHISRPMFSVRTVGRERLKGTDRHLEMVEVLWAPEQATIISSHGTASDLKQVQTALVVKYGDAQLRVDAKNPELTLGRTDVADLIVPSPAVSRLHARIEWQQGDLVYTDLSTNGTNVMPKHGDKRRLHRQSILLTGSGVLCLGRSLDTDHLNLVGYSIVSGADEETVVSTGKPF